MYTHIKVRKFAFNFEIGHLQVFKLCGHVTLLGRLYEKRAVNRKAFHGYVNSLRNLCRCVCKHILKLQFNESTTKYVR